MTRRIPWIAGALFALLLALHWRDGADARVFWRAGQRFLHGESLYPAADGFMSFRYAPGTALLFAPLAPFPFVAARILWGVVLALACAAVFRRLLPRATAGRAGAVALAAGLLVLRPALEEARGGQVNLVVLLLLLWSFAEVDRGREWFGGALLAPVVALKLAPGLILVDWGLRRRWRALGGAALGGAMVLAAPLPWYGISGTVALHRSWVDSLRSASPAVVAYSGNQSIPGAFARLGFPAGAALLACAALVVWVLSVRGEGLRRDLLLVVTVLASPMGWIQNFLLALPLGFRLASRGKPQSILLGALGVFLAFFIWDVAGPRAEEAFFHASGMTWVMLGVLAWAAIDPEGPQKGC